MYEDNVAGEAPQSSESPSSERRMERLSPDVDEVIREGIARGEHAVAEGRVLTQREAEARLARWGR